MPRPGAKPPEWAQSFRKIAELEAKNGFNDSAVVGGLDRFRQRWRNDMEGWGPRGNGTEFLLRRNYSDMAIEERQEWVRRWLSALGFDATQVSESSVSAKELQDSTVARDADRPAPTAEVSFPPGSHTLSKPPTPNRMPPAGQSVDAPVTQLKGINDKTATRMKRLDVATVRDLLYLFPRRHEDYSSVVSISGFLRAKNAPSSPRSGSRGW